MSASPNTTSLKDRAQEVFENLRNYYERHRVLPSVAELVDMTSVTTSKGSMAKILDILIDEDKLAKMPSGRLKPGRGFIDLIERTVGLPVGRPVPAGHPDSGDESYDERMAIDSYLAPDPSITKLFPINGDSMIDRKLFDRDYAVVEMGRQGKVGDAVLARIDGTETIKVLAADVDGSYLTPANASSDYPALRPTTELKVLGVIVGTFGKRH